MKLALIFVLFALISCQQGLVGGWERRSTAENNIYIDRSFREAFKSYSNSEDADPDDFIPLTVHSQVVAGTNYKVTFVDTKVNSPVVQEYIIHVPLPTQMRNAPKFIVLRHLEYRPNENINSENESYSLIQNHLVKGLEGTKEKVKEINSISTMENRENVFYVIDAQTENGNHKYIVAQDKFTKSLDYAQRLS